MHSSEAQPHSRGSRELAELTPNKGHMQRGHWSLAPTHPREEVSPVKLSVSPSEGNQLVRIDEDSDESSGPRTQTTKVIRLAPFQKQRIKIGSKEIKENENHLRQLPALPSTIIQYVDDTLIASINKDDHEKDLRVFLNHLSDNGHKASFVKAQISQEEVVYLGFIIFMTFLVIKCIRQLFTKRKGPTRLQFPEQAAELLGERTATQESRETTSIEILKILTPEEEHQESRETTSIEILKTLTPEKEHHNPQQNEIVKILTPEKEHKEITDDSNEPEMTPKEEHQEINDNSSEPEMTPKEEYLEINDDSSEPEMTLEEEYQVSKEEESNPPQMTDVTNINATSDHSHNSQEDTLNVAETTKDTDANNCDNDSNHPHGTLIERNKNNINCKKHSRNKNNNSNNKNNMQRNKNDKSNKKHPRNNKHDKKKNKNKSENNENRINKRDKKKNKNGNNKNDNENNKDRNDRNNNNETMTCTTWYNSARKGQCHSTLRNNDKTTNMPWHDKESQLFKSAPEKTGKTAFTNDDIQNQYHKHRKKSRSDNGATQNHYPQSNGTGEKGVNIIKRLISKAAESRSDINLALLSY
ncbi:uncharacterized protein [Scyliorhinus torazame]|uniref:uncharacterized protein n=1 Tax=Scyliorhinus torazame TaxID=75743 RepID=UPI003B5BCC3D